MTAELMDVITALTIDLRDQYPSGGRTPARLQQ